MMAKFEPNHMGRNVQNHVFGQKLEFFKSFSAILQDVSEAEIID